jgi:hypothetical protein
MNPVIALVAGGAALLALMSRRDEGSDATPDDGVDVGSEVKRIVEESREIVRGERDAYSDAPNVKVEPREAAVRVKVELDKLKANTTATDHAAEDAAALEAARRAAADEAAVVTVKPKPEPVKPKPEPVVVVKPKPEPVKPQPLTPQPPEGFDRTKAKNAAPGLAKNIKNNSYNYSRDALRAWQKVAGIPTDGVYGPGSRNALAYYVGEKNAPRALFAKAKDGTPYPNTPYPWRV